MYEELVKRLRDQDNCNVLDDVDEAADAIEAAVEKVLMDGYRTPDIYTDGCKKVGTVEMGDAVVAAL